MATATASATWSCLNLAAGGTIGRIASLIVLAAARLAHTHSNHGRRRCQARRKPALEVRSTRAPVPPPPGRAAPAARGPKPPGSAQFLAPRRGAALTSPPARRPAPARGPAGGAPQQRKRPARTSSGGGARAMQRSQPGILRFYADEAPGLKIGPTTVLVMSLMFIGFVVLLHIYGKLMS